MAPKLPIDINVLPTELLAHIFSYLDSPAPSDDRLHDQPDSAMLDAPQETNLKSISCVSKRWRAVSLPVLFRHVIWTVDRYRLLVDMADSKDPITMVPLLAFLRVNGLGRHVYSFTMLVGYRTVPPPPNIEFYAPAHLINPALTSLVESDEDRNWLWRALFDLMDPLRFTLIASPQALANLLSRIIFLNDADSFGSTPPLHILSLSRDPGAPTTLPPPSPSRRPYYHPIKRPRPRSILPTLRPWTHLLLNENSSIPVYKTYEFFLRRPPSILGALLSNHGTVSLIPPTLTSMSYVAIFPLATHFSWLVDRLPRLRRLFVQLTPRNDILLDPDEVRNVHAADLWMERNSCYTAVMQHMLQPPAIDGIPDDQWAAFTGGFGGDDGDGDSDSALDLEPEGRNWRFLEEFESGDTSDKEAWDMAVELLETGQRGVGSGQSKWRVEREGLLVRGPGNGGEEGTTHVPGEGNDGDGDEDGLGLPVDILMSFPPGTFWPW